jgi:hypothetical protein
MAIGAVLEPLVVVTLLFGGAYFNRNQDYDFWAGKAGWASDRSLKRDDDAKYQSDSYVSSPTWSSSPGASPSLSPHEQPTLRRRKVQLFGYKRIVSTPNTMVFKDRFLSRVLQKFPFLAEAWYWFLIYWVSHPTLSSTPAVSGAARGLRSFQMNETDHSFV